MTGAVDADEVDSCWYLFNIDTVNTTQVTVTLSDQQLCNALGLQLYQNRSTLNLSWYNVFGCWKHIFFINIFYFSVCSQFIETGLTELPVLSTQTSNVIILGSMRRKRYTQFSVTSVVQTLRFSLRRSLHVSPCGSLLLALNAARAGLSTQLMCFEQ